MKDEQVNVWSPSERFHGPSEVVSATLRRGWEVREDGGSDREGGAWGPVVPGLVKLQSFWRFYFYPLFNNQEHRKKCAFIPLCFYYISMKKRWTGAYPAVRCFLRPGVSAR